MPKTCKKCGGKFPFRVTINGKRKNLKSRRFCLSCSPFGKHNTRDLTGKIKPGPKPKLHTGGKICNFCNRVRHISSFYKGYGTCKKCTNRKKLGRDIVLKKKAIAYKGGCCKHCGYEEHYAALQFHHLRDKEASWNDMRNMGWEKVRKELDKCELLCANCHHIVHSKSPVHF